MENNNSIQVSELKLLIENDRKLQIIDVRSVEEFNEQHIPNAENIQLPQLLTKEFAPDAEEIIVMACTHGGGRSQNAASALKEKGIQNVYFLEGGTVGWFQE